MYYMNKFRTSPFVKKIKKKVISSINIDVPTYILIDVMERLDRGEKEITISMLEDGHSTRSIAEYLSEYHRSNRCWDSSLLHVAFDVTSDRIKRKLSCYSDIEVDVIQYNFHDKRVRIRLTR